MRTMGLWLGAGVALALLLFADLDPHNRAVTAMAAVAALMAVLWVTEALPLAATALIPLVAFPLLQIASTKDTAASYINSTIFLFVGGFLIAQSLERWGLHRRIALGIIGAIGGSPDRILWGFLCATAFLSMWISNTATAVMMVPIGLSIVYKLEARFGEERARPFAVALMLSIAYGASIGGVATLVGTPPNLALARIYQISFPQYAEISFAQWLAIGLPVALLMLSLCWWVLTRLAFRLDQSLRISAQLLDAERAALGVMSGEERRVATVFVATALSWIFRADIDTGWVTIPGWERWLPDPGMIDDGTVAIVMGLLLFLLPAPTGGRLLEQDAFQKLPWSIILLFGGGFALAKGFTDSGLSAFIGDRLAGLADAPVAVLVAAVAGAMTALTELTSNTATAQMILPVMAALAQAIGVHPLLLMVPATLAASFAFMLPVATPPNAIVFGSGRLRVMDMVKAGVWLNLLGLLVITVLSLLLVPWVFAL